MAYSIQKYHGKYNRSARTSAVDYIVVHYVGSGTSAEGAAKDNCRYFAGGDRQTSAHYFVDDGSIWEYADPSAYATWHCGDGGGRYGITNGNSIGIEVCQSGDRPYTEAEVDRLAWLVRKLMADFGVPAGRVVRHYDASRKACPLYYTPHGSGGDAAWTMLHERITSEEEEVTDADIEKIATLAAEKVWNYVLNDVMARDRLIGTDAAANRAANEVCRTDDPSNRGMESTTHEHMKWIAAKQATMDEKIDGIVSMVASLVAQNK